MKRSLPILLVLILTVTPAYAQLVDSYFDVQIGTSWPRSIVVNPLMNQIFVTTVSGIYPPTGFTITMIDANSNSIMAVVPYQGIPGEMSIDVKTNTVYVVNSTSILVLDGTRRQIVGSIQVKAPLYDLAFDPSTRLLYATGANDLFRINVTQLKVVGSVPVGRYAESVAINPHDDSIYVANFGSSSVTVVDGGAFMVKRTITLPQDASPSSIAFDTLTNKLFVATGRNYVLAIDALTGGVGAKIEVGAFPTQNSTYSLAIDSRMDEVFVASSPGTLLTVIDATSDRVIAGVKLSHPPFEIASNPSNGNVYVTNYHLVSVINSGNLPSGASGNRLPLVFGIAAIAVVFVYASWKWAKVSKANSARSNRFTSNDEVRDSSPRLRREDPLSSQ